MLPDRSRFPATAAFLGALDGIPPHIDFDDIPGARGLPAAVYADELAHWRLTYTFWTGERPPCFVRKRIEHMTDAEFRSWCYQSPASLKAWVAWVCS